MKTKIAFQNWLLYGKLLNQYKTIFHPSCCLFLLFVFMTGFAFAQSPQNDQIPEAYINSVGNEVVLSLFFEDFVAEGTELNLTLVENSGAASNVEITERKDLSTLNERFFAVTFDIGPDVEIDTIETLVFEPISDQLLSYDQEDLQFSFRTIESDDIIASSVIALPLQADAPVEFAREDGIDFVDPARKDPTVNDRIAIFYTPSHKYENGFMWTVFAPDGRETSLYGFETEDDTYTYRPTKEGSPAQFVAIVELNKPGVYTLKTCPIERTGGIFGSSGGIVPQKDKFQEVGAFEVTSSLLHYQGFIMEPFPPRPLPISEYLVESNVTLRKTGEQQSISLKLEASWDYEYTSFDETTKASQHTFAKGDFIFPDTLDPNASEMGIGKFKIEQPPDKEWLDHNAKTPYSVERHFSTQHTLAVKFQLGELHAIAKAPPEREMFLGQAASTPYAPKRYNPKFPMSDLSEGWGEVAEKELLFKHDYQKRHAPFGVPKQTLSGHLLNKDTLFVIPVKVELYEDIRNTNDEFVKLQIWGYAIYGASPGHYTGPMPTSHDVLPESVATQDNQRPDQANKTDIATKSEGLKNNDSLLSENEPAEDVQSTNQALDPEISIAEREAQADCSDFHGTEPKWFADEKEMRCVCPDPNKRYNSTLQRCATRGEFEVAKASCADFPGTEAQWNKEQQEVRCECIETNKRFNNTLQRCATREEFATAKANCDDFPGTKAQWHEETQDVRCDCIDPDEKYNKKLGQCVSREEFIVAQTNCSKWDNATAIWDKANQRAVCDCVDDYQWNNAETACIKKPHLQVANTRCSKWLNSTPTWNQEKERVECDCVGDYEWNSPINDQCRIRKDIQLAEFDCYKWPNSTPKWNNKTQSPYCACVGDYEPDKVQGGCRVKKEIQVAKASCRNSPGTRPEWNEKLNKVQCVCTSGSWSSSKGRCVSDRERALAGLNCGSCEKPYYDESKGKARCVCASGCGYDSSISDYCLPDDEIASIRRQRRWEQEEREEQERRAREDDRRWQQELMDKWAREDEEKRQRKIEQDRQARIRQQEQERRWREEERLRKEKEKQRNKNKVWAGFGDDSGGNKPNWDSGCNDRSTGGARYRGFLRDPPPYHGKTLFCSDRSGILWFLGARILSIDKSGAADSDGCYPNSSLTTTTRTYKGKICPP